jgi:crossover junction endodeoxyribonuclease RusA
VTAVVFTVHGEPAPQGSKTVGRTKAGASFVREDNPATEPWRNAVTAAAVEAMDGRTPIAGPVRLEVDFVFARPKSHYRTGKRAGELKPSAPHYRASRPDVDKLVRALGDSLTGVALVDDGAIVELVTRKVYGSPGAHVAISELAA